jgi:hypothetical protein
MDTSGNYIRNQFCSYEIALKLKELGFDEPCFGCWENNIEFHIPFVVGYDLIAPDNFNSKDNCVSAPLWQQCVEWFREMCCIFIEIKVGDYFDTLEESYSYQATCKVFKNGELDGTAVVRDKQNNHIFYSYYEARKQAIFKCIELIKDK